MSSGIGALGTPSRGSSKVRPWYRHLIYSAVSILTGIYLIHVGQIPEGTAMVGAGVAFLGVGSGSEFTSGSGGA